MEEAGWEEEQIQSPSVHGMVCRSRGAGEIQEGECRRTEVQGAGGLHPEHWVSKNILRAGKKSKYVE